MAEEPKLPPGRVGNNPYISVNHYLIYLTENGAYVQVFCILRSYTVLENFEG